MKALQDPTPGSFAPTIKLVITLLIDPLVYIYIYMCVCLFASASEKSIWRRRRWSSDEANIWLEKGTRWVMGCVPHSNDLTTISATMHLAVSVLTYLQSTILWGDAADCRNFLNICPMPCQLYALILATSPPFHRLNRAMILTTFEVNEAVAVWYTVC